MKKKLNDLQILLLSVLADNSATGYDIKKSILKANLWNASHQQIYRCLGELFNGGFVTANDVPQAGKPDKRVYTVSEAGQLALAEATLESKFKPRVMRSYSSIALKIGSATYFAAMIDAIENQLEALGKQFVESNSDVSKLILSRDLALLNADLLFARSAMAHIKGANK